MSSKTKNQVVLLLIYLLPKITYYKTDQNKGIARKNSFALYSGQVDDHETGKP